MDVVFLGGVSVGEARSSRVGEVERFAMGVCLAYDRG